MIKKYNVRAIVFGIIAALVVIIGGYLHANVISVNVLMERLKEEGIVQVAAMEKMTDNYTPGEKYKWGLRLADSKNEKGFDGTTNYYYTVAEAEEMDYSIEVVFLEDGEELIVYEKVYVDNFKYWVPSGSIFMFILGGIIGAVALIYLTLSLLALYTSKHGFEYNATYIDTVSTFWESRRNYRIKYVYNDGSKDITVISPAIYSGKQANAMQESKSLVVKKTKFMRLLMPARQFFSEFKLN